ncbi:hypothetical protein VitviT2T_014811 [Vitis vinifera]|uniref:Subtilisin-like protease SBT5.3 n=1 Tax=Vitis vinifera TaxID=29760 RepID=A0ABY9CM45_VITVI|nr:hypothetical protein VitviT2T_014811 [Vitis vinifera]
MLLIELYVTSSSYVVYLGSHSHGVEPTSSLHFSKITDSYYDLLGSCMGSKKKAQEAIFYSYTSYINGFAAVLEDEEAAELSKQSGVLSVFLNQKNELHTTRSWEFLGLERNGEIPANSIWVKARFGEDIIIGNLDTGVWPESDSFNDKGMEPIPSKWKGYLLKLIGARYFNKGYEAALGRPLDSSYQTARDTNGHGTHTLSTAGGGFVGGANLLGSGYGTARGGSPSARVASYKVCWPSCYDADILAAFDAAIHDGVDVLSVSLGGPPRDYFLDSIAIGSFQAVKKGIVVVCSAGNSGPTPGSVENLAPWIITVAASTIDRDFPSYVMLGNNEQFKGLSFYTNSLPAAKFYPLVYSVDARAPNASARDAQLCFVGSLDPEKVKGKIVYCLIGLNEIVQKSWVVAQAGGIGMILANRLSTSTLIPQAHFVPTSYVSAADGLAILLYIHITKYPVAYIRGATEVGTVAAPIMASFSSQGLNTITPGILKPDITAPGVNILAAYIEAKGPTFLQSDDRRVLFNIVSGTSMSCPHVSGTVGLLKKIHPHWSPSAIRSAIMTTERTRNNVRQPMANGTLEEANPFNYGAGHLWPNRAMDPGLVYDLTTIDYLNFLCTIGYNATLLSRFVDEPYECPPNPMSVLDLNYPSITVPSFSGKVTVTRTLKNVGSPATYTVRTEVPSGLLVKVEPERLKFEKINEEKTFKVTLEAKRDESYVVYLGGHSHGAQPPSASDFSRITDSHHDLLGSCMSSKKKAREAIFYSYTRYINGFAAVLEDEEAAELSKKPGVVSVFLNQKNELHTTRSWEFLGLERNGEIPADSIWTKGKFGEDIIIGNLDTGVWPESESFNDQGIGPIPSKWKGYCETNDGVKCNRKLIGARYFNKGYEAALGKPLNSSYQTARDTDRHGTHTLSTAGGGFVGGANLLGSGYGTAKGGSPSARVASYKYLENSQIPTDAAIHDGVDVLSLSLGFPRGYFLDSVAVGSFQAVKNGIVVVCSAGNSGPTPGSVENSAPWIITVAASTIDRDSPSYVMLGNNRQFKGLSFYTNSLPAEKFYPLVYSVDARAPNASARDAQLCFVGSLDPEKVKGKIVYCLIGLNEIVQKSWVVAQAGGIGMILANRLSTSTLIPQAHFVPTSYVSAADGGIRMIIAHRLSTGAIIHRAHFVPTSHVSATEVGTVVAPIMASTSAQGPNPIAPEILKVDYKL